LVAPEALVAEALELPAGEREEQGQERGAARQGAYLRTLDCRAVSDARKRLRAALAGPRMLVAPFVWDGLQARLAEAAGFEAVYMTGFGTAAARGLPDLGLLGMSEMVDNARTLARAVRVPVICDADTGYGGPLNVMRTVEAYQDAGAAAVHLEDQVFPKRCGFLGGKQVVPLAEMTGKLRAACDARSDPDLVLIGRTDALEAEGWDGAERRARAYRDAGADLVFVDGIRSLEDLDTYARRLGDLPCVYNGQLAPAADVDRRGFRLMLHIASLVGAFRALQRTYADLRQKGQLASAADPRAFEELLEVLGAPGALETARRYES
jgi:2-methylisocitrate lyase-like PEP mutase family enzyme